MLAAVVGRKPCVLWCWCWAKLLARQELAAREPGESYCSLDEGHFPFRMAWQMLSRRLMMTRSYRGATQQHRTELLMRRG